MVQETKVKRFLRSPRSLVGSAVRRILPRHPKFGVPWVRTSDGSITFRERGFVSATSPATLLARHNFETLCIRRLLAGVHAPTSLEIGCGFGRLTPTFAEFSKRHLAVDINESAIARAQATYGAYEFRLASADDLPFDDDSFGLVTTWTVLQHVPPDRIDRAASEIVRVLQPGGTLLICEETRYPDATDRNPHTWHRSEETYVSIFSSLTLECSEELVEVDRLEGMESPGRVMLWRAPVVTGRDADTPSHHPQR